MKIRDLVSATECALAHNVLEMRLHHAADDFHQSGGISIKCPVCLNGQLAIVKELRGGGVDVLCNGCGDTIGILQALERVGPAPGLALDSKQYLPLKLFTPDKLLKLAEPKWLVEPFVPEAGFVVLFGQTGTYKTFLAIDIAGRADGLAVYVAAEGSPRRFGERVLAWETAAGRPSGIRVHPYAVNLLDLGDVEALAGAIRSLAESVRLVVIDTTARNTPGANENSTQDTGRLVGVMDQLRTEFGCATLAVHHSGYENTKRERGSSALRAAADVSILTKRTALLEVRLECAKSRDAEECEPRTARLIPQGDSLAVVEAVTRRDAVEQDVTAYLVEHPGASQRDVEDAVTGRRDAVRAAYKLCKSKGEPHDSSQSTTSSPADAQSAPNRRGALSTDNHVGSDGVRRSAPNDGAHPGSGCAPAGAPYKGRTQSADPRNAEEESVRRWVDQRADKLTRAAENGHVTLREFETMCGVLSHVDRACGGAS